MVGRKHAGTVPVWCEVTTWDCHHDALIPCYRNIRENASDKNSGRNTGDSPVVPAQRQQRDSPRVLRERRNGHGTG